jgi:hypothetical protein
MALPYFYRELSVNLFRVLELLPAQRARKLGLLFAPSRLD